MVQKYVARYFVVSLRNIGMIKIRNRIQKLKKKLKPIWTPFSALKLLKSDLSYKKTHRWWRITAPKGKSSKLKTILSFIFLHLGPDLNWINPDPHIPRYQNSNHKSNRKSCIMVKYAQTFKAIFENVWECWSWLKTTLTKILYIFLLGKLDTL